MMKKNVIHVSILLDRGDNISEEPETEEPEISLPAPETEEPETEESEISLKHQKQNQKIIIKY